jgi:hypothetical protein
MPLCDAFPCEINQTVHIVDERKRQISILMCRHVIRGTKDMLSIKTTAPSTEATSPSFLTTAPFIKTTEQSHTTYKAIVA